MGRKGRIIHGAAGAVAAIVVTKLIGALYKIPLGNLLGSRGMAHFYAAYNVYNVVLLLTTAGMTVAVSRLVSARSAQRRYGQARRILYTALTMMTAAGLLGGGVMLLGAGPLAMALHDSGAKGAIAMLGPAVCCVCIVSALRGGTQGLGDMAPTAVGQILESLTKLTVGLGCCFWLLRRGSAPETAAAGAMAGVTAGEVVCFFYMLRYLPRRTLPPGDDAPDTRRETVHQLLAIAAPITAGGAAMSLITLLDQSLTLGTLQSALGYTADRAAELYGQYTYGLTLFVLPGAVLSPLTAALIPRLAAERARGRYTRCAALARTALRRTALLAFPMGLGLSALAEPLLGLLYAAVPETAAAAADHLGVLGFAAVAVCLMGLATGILQALGRERTPLLVLLCGGAVKIAVNRLLVADPSIGIHGAAVGTLCCYGVMAALSLLAAQRAMPGLAVGSATLRAAVSAFVMYLWAMPIYRFFTALLPRRWAVLPAVAACAAVYAVLALATGAVHPDDLHALWGRPTAPSAT